MYQLPGLWYVPEPQFSLLKNWGDNINFVLSTSQDCTKSVLEVLENYRNASHLVSQLVNKNLLNAYYVQGTMLSPGVQRKARKSFLSSRISQWRFAVPYL